ncbi:unnamed protein product [Fraxinus pennsylvanica]|uniref:Cullin N-terminal domain-containing protein n=1 Tax=Fraxinus pennsylvanica TaxID=56036 RepID=A0AAD2A1N5_9LAMI|nr:unnamed protein product [Fraxinus pennsylvanica]
MEISAPTKRDLSFEQVWPFLQEAINKVIDNLEGVDKREFTSEEYMQVYTTVYNACCPNPVGPEAEKLYDHYRKTFEDYISSKVLPSLRGKNDENLLRELLRRWNNHKTMVKWLSRFFHYLQRYFIGKKRLPSLEGTGHLAFYNLVYSEINNEVRDTILSLIDKERKGEQIDQAMVKSVLDIYLEIGENSTKYYAKDFEESMIKDTTTFYSQNALNWIETESYENYMVKVEECLEQEKARTSSYLNYRSKFKLLEVVQHELLNVHAVKLEEKKHITETAA